MPSYVPADQPRQIGIDPPIPWDGIAGHRLLDGHLHPYDPEFLVRLVGPTVRDTEGRLLNQRFTPGPVDGISVVGWTLDVDAADTRRLADIQEIVDAHGAGRTFTGALQINGDDRLRTMRRLIVRGGRAMRIRPYLMYVQDDGSTEHTKPYERALAEGRVRGHDLLPIAPPGSDPDRVLRWECTRCKDVAVINARNVYGNAVARDCGDSRFPEDSTLWSQ